MRGTYVRETTVCETTCVSETNSVIYPGVGAVSVGLGWSQDRYLNIHATDKRAERQGALGTWACVVLAAIAVNGLRVREIDATLAFIAFSTFFREMALL